ncbi:hypothetical protein [Nocardioides sp.]|uniref:hypothetical protein n=1 Tax=Nocardioides sp. TaxID=35761 RepID=UPI00261D1ED1|nr:hypothetical protein [Nocardioides sp.]
MLSWLQDFGELLLVWIGVQIVLGGAIGGLWSWERRLGRALVRVVRHEPDAAVLPLRRPIERIAADVCRLHDAFHHDGMRFAKYEGCRLAYDSVLAEAAETLELDHLMAVLPPGVERDRERERIERLLTQAGLLPRSRAA